METKLWREMLGPYRQAVDELVVKFKHIKQEYQNAGMYSPIESVSGRVKRISSILDKAQRKGVPIEQIEEKIEDIAGVRIICQFVEDINTVVDIIRKRSDLTVKREKDYISKSKPSGYRSYHIIVYYTVQTFGEPKTIEAEIQIRTLAMNFWSTIEHSLNINTKKICLTDLGNVYFGQQMQLVHLTMRWHLCVMKLWTHKIPTDKKQIL